MIDKLLTDAALEAFNRLSEPVAGHLFGLAIEQLLRRRNEAARKVLLDELRHGSRTIDRDEMEEAIAIFNRYARAAVEGAARLNLRLMARVIDRARCASGPRNPGRGGDRACGRWGTPFIRSSAKWSVPPDSLMTTNRKRGWTSSMPSSARPRPRRGIGERAAPRAATMRGGRVKSGG
jgi:hypothetical protein